MGAESLPFTFSLVIETQQNNISLCGKGKKSQAKYKVLQNANERWELCLPDLKVYFAACCLVSMKKWALLRNKRLLVLEGHDLRFGWHNYLWYNKVKVNVDLKNHYVKCAILRRRNRYKLLDNAQSSLVTFSTRSILYTR